MNDVKLSATREAVLRGVALGEVKHHRNWGHDPDEDVWRPATGGRKKVNAAVKYLRDARLVALGPATGPSMYSARLWQLTEAGERWLAEHEEAA
jgi:hypothetical protein